MSSGTGRTDEQVFEYLRMRAGLSRQSLHRNGAHKAISRLQNRANVKDQRELLRRLVCDDNLFDALIADVTVGETHFFRHRAQLDAIKTQILPALSRERPAGHVYRIWSAGCATGEEAYTLAILAEEEGLGRRTSILATDISKPALKRAELGEYSSWSFRGLDQTFIERHFDTEGKFAKIRKSIRDRVRFRVLNLALDDYPTQKTETNDLDLLLCRNVLIYFDGEAVAATAARLYACLAPGGWLVLGPSDPPLWHHVPLTPILLPGAVIYRRDASKAVSALPRQVTTSRPPVCRPSKRLAPGSLITEADPPRRHHKPEAAKGTNACREILNTAQSRGVAEAERIAAACLAQDPLAADVRYLRSVLLMSLNNDQEAIAELRRLVYLDRSHVAAHFTLGILFHKNRDTGRARRFFTNAYRLALTLPPDEQVAMAEGLTAAELASLAKERIIRLTDNETVTPGA